MSSAGDFESGAAILNGRLKMASKRRPARAASITRAPTSKQAVATRPSTGAATRATRRLKADAALRIASGLDSQAQADRLAARGERDASIAIQDLDEGAVLTDIAEDMGALSAAATALSLSEVERGMELAAMAGQIGTVADAVRVMGMSSLGSFLNDMSLRMRAMAVRDMLESQDGRGLARAIGDAGAGVGALGESDLAAGMAGLASAQDAADASQLAAEVGALEIASGLVEEAAADTRVKAGAEVVARRGGGVAKRPASRTGKQGRR